MPQWEYRMRKHGDAWLEFGTPSHTLRSIEAAYRPPLSPFRQLETNLWISADGSYVFRQQNVLSEPLAIKMDPAFSLDELELAQKMIAGKE